MLRSNLVRLLAVLLLAGGGSSRSLAETIRLNELLGGQTLQSGDKLFSDFSYAATENMPLADAVNVITIQDQDGNYGIRFQGGFFDLPGGSASDALVTFKVTALDVGMQISGARLSANPTVTDGGVVSVTETFLPTFSGPTDIMDVTSGINLADQITFSSPVTSLWVQKDILVYAGDSVATVSFVDQTFPQVPEPGSLAILSLGLVGLWQVRRRRGR